MDTSLGVMSFLNFLLSELNPSQLFLVFFFGGGTVGEHIAPISYRGTTS